MNGQKEFKHYLLFCMLRVYLKCGDRDVILRGWKVRGLRTLKLKVQFVDGSSVLRQHYSSVYTVIKLVFLIRKSLSIEIGLIN